MSEPREYTPEEVRAMFLQHIRTLVTYWERVPQAPTAREKLEGLAFSILVTLEGNPEDWALIRDKAERLGKYELHWWMENLLPTLEQFVAASKGNIDMGFWRNFYKDPKESGGPKFGGELLTLFPYLRVGDKDSRLVRNTDPNRYVSTLNIPTSVTQVPWVWKYLGTDYNMEFRAGFLAAAQDSETGTMMPVLGTIIREVK